MWDTLGVLLGLICMWVSAYCLGWMNGFDRARKQEKKKHGHLNWDQ